MIDFLTFNSFITPYVLIFFYYAGVLFLPYVVYKARFYIFREKYKEYLKNNKQVVVVIVVLILLAEIFWRMMFEMMIGYFDIHNYLHQIAVKK